jgi:hypothetical protein
VLPDARCCVRVFPACSDNEYFFDLVARMTRDVENQPVSVALNPRRGDTLATLYAVAKEAKQRKPAAS